MTIAVLPIHGMGSQSENDFAVTFIGEMRRRLGALGVGDDEVAWGRGYWADLLNERERQLLADMDAGGALRWRDLRRFVVEALGDAVAYRRGTTDGRNLYYDIHRRIVERVRALHASVGGRDVPLVIVAHSLGTVIASDFVWDAQHPENRLSEAANAFERMETLAGIVTMGSPIPLFSLALPKVVAVAPPRASPGLSDAVRRVARWENFYDPDDVLGWPLRTLGQGDRMEAGEHAYADAVEADHAVNVGGVATSWNPLSHTGYWRDREVLRRAGELIADVARAARDAQGARAAGRT